MEQRISIVTLGVADLDRSRKFYERLGWRRSMATAEGIVFFRPVYEFTNTRRPSIRQLPSSTIRTASE